MRLGDAAGAAGFSLVSLDSVDSTPDHLVFNRSVSLKDSFKK